MITALITTSNYLRADKLMERLSGSVYRSIYLRYTNKMKLRPKQSQRTIFLG